MIFIRRFLAVILALVVIVLFVFFAVLSRVNGTFGNPDFYIEQLQKADIYNFIYDEGMPAVLDEAVEDVDLDGTTIELEKFKSNLVSSTRQVLPPEWIQARVEDTISKVLPYLLGDTDAFLVTVPLKGRVTELGETLKETVHGEDVFPELYDAAVTYAVDQGMSGLEDAPFAINLTREEMESAVGTLVPRTWLQTQIDGATDQLVPYMTGEAEHFEVTLELKSRLHAAEDVAVDLLGRPETYDYLFDEVVTPAITEEIGGSVELPYGVTVTQEEVMDSFKEILPRPWFKERMEEIVGEAVSYMDGTSDTFDVSIPLEDRKAKALEVVESLANRKFEGVLEALPTCSPKQLQELVQNPPTMGQLPPCRPAGVSAEQLKQALDIDFGLLVESEIGVPIPDHFRFTKDDLTRIAGEGNEDVLEEARKYVSEGWRYTDADLRETLNEEDEKRLDDAREWISGGFTFTEEDLREKFEEFAEEDVPFEDIDQVRDWLGQARQWSSVVGWLVLGVLSVLTGFLGGRNWYSRLAWAAAPLLVASAIFYVVCGPLYSGTSRAEIERAIRESIGEVPAWASVFVEKAITVAQNVADTFMAGIANQSLVVLIVAGLTMVGAVVLQVVRPRR